MAYKVTPYKNRTQFNLGTVQPDGSQTNYLQWGDLSIPLPNRAPRITESVQQTPQNYFLDYNDPYVINSISDVLLNREAKRRRYGEWASTPIIGDILSVPVATLDLLWNSTAKPIVGRISEQLEQAEIDDTSKTAAFFEGLGRGGGIALLNNLSNFGETMDVLANPIKGALLEEQGPLTGFVNGLGLGSSGRVNYDYDTGNFALNMVLEVISDPINWVTFGTKAAASSAIKGVVSEVGSEIGEEVAESTVKRVSKNLTRRVLNSKSLDDIAQNADKIAREAVGDISFFKKLSSTILGSTDEISEEVSQRLTQRLTEQISNGVLSSIDDLSLAHRLYRGANAFEDVLKGSVKYTTNLPLLGTYRALKKGKNALQSRTLQKAVLANIEDLKGLIDNPEIINDFVKGANTVSKKEAINHTVRTYARKEVSYLNELIDSFKEFHERLQDFFMDGLEEGVGTVLTDSSPTGLQHFREFLDSYAQEVSTRFSNHSNLSLRNFSDYKAFIDSQEIQSIIGTSKYSEFLDGVDSIIKLQQRVHDNDFILDVTDTFENVLEYTDSTEYIPLRQQSRKQLIQTLVRINEELKNIQTDLTHNILPAGTWSPTKEYTSTQDVLTNLFAQAQEIAKKVVTDPNFSDEAFSGSIMAFIKQAEQYKDVLQEYSQRLSRLKDLRVFHRGSLNWNNLPELREELVAITALLNKNGGSEYLIKQTSDIIAVIDEVLEDNEYFDAEDSVRELIEKYYNPHNYGYKIASPSEDVLLLRDFETIEAWLAKDQKLSNASKAGTYTIPYDPLKLDLIKNQLGRFNALDFKSVQNDYLDFQDSLDVAKQLTFPFTNSFEKAMKNSSATAKEFYDNFEDNIKGHLRNIREAQKVQATMNFEVIEDITQHVDRLEELGIEEALNSWGDEVTGELQGPKVDYQEAIAEFKDASTRLQGKLDTLNQVSRIPSQVGSNNSSLLLREALIEDIQSEYTQVLEAYHKMRELLEYATKNLKNAEPGADFQKISWLTKLALESGDTAPQEILPLDKILKDLGVLDTLDTATRSQYDTFIKEIREASEQYTDVSVRYNKASNAQAIQRRAEFRFGTSFPEYDEAYKILQEELGVATRQLDQARENLTTFLETNYSSQELTEIISRVQEAIPTQEISAASLRDPQETGVSIVNLIRELPEVPKEFDTSKAYLEYISDIDIAKELAKKNVAYSFQMAKSHVNTELLRNPRLVTIASQWRDQADTPVVRFLQNNKDVAEVASLIDSLENFGAYQQLVEKIYSIPEEILPEVHKHGILDSIAGDSDRSLLSIADQVDWLVERYSEQAGFNVRARKDIPSLKLEDLNENLVDKHIKDATSSAERSFWEERKSLASQSHTANSDVHATHNIMAAHPETAPSRGPNDIIVTFDFEATGLHTKSDNIFQVGYSITPPEENLTSSKVHQIVMNPQNSPSAGALQGLGWDLADYKANVIDNPQALSEADGLRRFLNDLQAHKEAGSNIIFTGYNIKQYDMKLLKNRIEELFTGNEQRKFKQLLYGSKTHDVYEKIARLHGVEILTEDAKVQLKDLVHRYIEDQLDRQAFYFAEPANSSLATTLHELAETLKISDKTARIKLEQLPPDEAKIISNLFEDSSKRIRDTLQSVHDTNKQFKPFIFSKNDLIDGQTVMSALMAGTTGVPIYGAYKRYDVPLSNAYFELAPRMSFIELQRSTNHARRIERIAERTTSTTKLRKLQGASNEVWDALYTARYTSPMGGQVSAVFPELRKLRRSENLVSDFAAQKYLYERTMRNFPNDTAAQLWRDDVLSQLSPDAKELFLELQGYDNQTFAFNSKVRRRFLEYTDEEYQQLLKTPVPVQEVINDAEAMTDSLTKASQDPLDGLSQVVENRGLLTATKVYYQRAYKKVAGYWDRFQDVLKNISKDEHPRLVSELSEAVDIYGKHQVSSLLQTDGTDLLQQMYLSGGRKVFHMADTTLDPVTRQSWENAGIRVFEKLEEKGKGVWYYLVLDKNIHSWDTIPKDYIPELTQITGLVKNSEIDEVLQEFRRDLKSKYPDLGDGVGDVMTYDIMNRFDANVPEEAQSYLIPLSDLTEAQFFETPRTNHMALGTAWERNKFVMGEDFSPSAIDKVSTTNIMKQYTTSASYHINLADTRAKYLSLYYNDAGGLRTSELFKDFTDRQIVELLKEHPEYTVSALVESDKTTTGIMVQRFYLNNASDVAEARRLNAVVLPTVSYNSVVKVVNEYKVTPLMRILSAVAMTYKSGYLGSLGHVVRNLFDGFIRNTITLQDAINIPRTISHWFQSLKLFMQYEEAAKKVMSNFPDEPMMNTRVLREWVAQQAGESLTDASIDLLMDTVIDDLGMTPSMFQLIHAFVEQGPSGGRIDELKNHALEVASKGQIPGQDASTFDRVMAGYTDAIMRIPGYSHLRTADGYIEQSLRLSTYLQELEHGKNTLEAMQSVIKIHFDYADKSLGMHTFETFFPFMTFAIRNLEYYADTVGKTPGLLSVARDIFTPVWDLDSLTVPNAYLYEAYDRGFDLEDEFNLKPVTPWANVPQGLLYHTLAGNVKIDSGRTAWHQAGYDTNKDGVINGEDLELRKIYQVLKINPSAMDAANMLFTPVDSVTSRLLPPYTWLIENTGALLAGKKPAETQLMKDGLLENLPFIGVLAQRYQGVQQRVEDSGNPLNYLASLFGTTSAKVKPQLSASPPTEKLALEDWLKVRYSEYKTYVLGEEYNPYERYSSLINERLPNRRNAQFFRKGGFKGNRYYQRITGQTYYADTFRSYTTLARINKIARPQNIYTELYTKSGHSRIKLNMGANTSKNLKYRIANIRYRLRSKWSWYK